MFSLLLASGSIYCSNSEYDPFRPGKVYDKDGSYIYIERPWFGKDDIIINLWPGLQRPKTQLYGIGCALSALASGYIAYYTFLDKRYYEEVDPINPVRPGGDPFFNKNYIRNDATISDLIVQMGLSLGLGLASIWLFRNQSSLVKEEKDGIQPAREFVKELYNKIGLSGRFNRIKCVESKYVQY